MNQTHWIQLYISICIIALFICISILFIYLYLKRLRQEQEMAQNLIIEKEATLRFVATELHDHIGQLCYLQRLHLTQIEPELQTDPIRSAIQLNHTIHHSIQQLCNSFHEDLISQLGFITAIESMIQLSNETGKIQISLHHDTFDHNAISQHQQFLLLRIIQEHIHNCMKHSDAQRIDIMLSSQQQLHTINIIDDHQAIVQHAIRNNALGKHSIRARLMLLKAKHNYDHVPDQAFTIVFKANSIVD